MNIIISIITIIVVIGIFIGGVYLMCWLRKLTEEEKYSKLSIFMLLVPIVMYFAFNGVFYIADGMLK